MKYKKHEKLKKFFEILKKKKRLKGELN